MKKMFLIVALAFGIGFSAEVPDSLLTTAQKVMVEANNKVQEAKTTQAVASSYIGIGKEVGTAVRESMSAITEETNKLANTGVGHLLIFIILYKVLQHLVLSLIATLFTLFFTWTFYTVSVVLGYKWYVKKDKETVIESNRVEWFVYSICAGVVAIIITLVSVWNIG